MSYGRQPYFIYSDGNYMNFCPPLGTEGPRHIFVPEDAIDQLIASIALTGGTELQERITHGLELRGYEKPIKVTLE